MIWHRLPNDEIDTGPWYSEGEWSCQLVNGLWALRCRGKHVCYLRKAGGWQEALDEAELAIGRLVTTVLK